MPDCDSLVRNQPYSNIVSLFQSGTGLTGCRTVSHFCVYVHGHWDGHAALTWTRTCSMDMDMDTQHRFGHAAWIWTMDLQCLHGCLNAATKFSPASLVYNAQSGIGIPASWSVHYRYSRISSSAQLWVDIVTKVSESLWSWQFFPGLILQYSFQPLWETNYCATGRFSKICSDSIISFLNLCNNSTWAWEYKRLMCVKWQKWVLHVIKVQGKSLINFTKKWENWKVKT